LLVANVLVTGSLVLTLASERTIWPPPQRKSWEFWFTWVCAAIGFVGVPLLGLIDRGSLGWSGGWQLPLGLALAVGFVVGFWAVGTLSAYQTLGLAGALHREGPYRYCRNLQYTCDLLFSGGVMLASGSLYAVISGVPLLLWFLLAPFCEERWLGRRFGPEYESYRLSTPRFLPRLWRTGSAGS